MTLSWLNSLKVNRVALKIQSVPTQEPCYKPLFSIVICFYRISMWNQPHFGVQLPLNIDDSKLQWPLKVSILMLQNHSRWNIYKINANHFYHQTQSSLNVPTMSKWHMLHFAMQVRLFGHMLASLCSPSIWHLTFKVIDTFKICIKAFLFTLQQSPYSPK